MKFTKFRLSVLLSMIALFVVACSPEDGDTGPVGPVGPPGPSGGGPQGPPGEDGNANVTAYVFTVLSTDYDAYTNQSQTFYMHRDTLSVSQIDNEVVNLGTVQLFRKPLSGGTSWSAMSYNRGGISYNYSYSLGEVQLEISYSNNAPINMSDAEFKVVVIPPAGLKHGVDPMNHEMLQAVYGI